MADHGARGGASAIRRVLGQRAFAAGFLVAGVLVFSWPFVRAPRLHLVPAFAHLVVAWASW